MMLKICNYLLIYATLFNTSFFYFTKQKINLLLNRIYQEKEGVGEIMQKINPEGF